MTFDRPWTDYSYLAFDTETSGAYPITSEVVEIGMVKWKGGQIVDRYELLIRPKRPVPKEIIAIHGITNEMLADAEPIEPKIKEIRSYFEDVIPVAHHAPFDMGFLAWDFERLSIPMPTLPVVCTSLLARNMITGTPNHKLQTLIPALNIPQGKAHRAMDDAEACLHVALHCFAKLGATATLDDVIKKQGKRLEWQDYSLLSLQRSPIIRAILEAIQNDHQIDFIYMQGSHRGKPRKAKPLGVVRSPDGDYLKAFCMIDNAEKRFYLGKITEAEEIFS